MSPRNRGGYIPIDEEGGWDEEDVVSWLLHRQPWDIAIHEVEQI